MLISIARTKEEDLLPISQAAAKGDGGDDSEASTYQISIKVHQDEVIFLATWLLTLIILQLPMKYVNGKPLPIPVFGNMPPAFYGFLMCLVGAACSSVCSIHLRKTNAPKIARLYYVFSVLCLFSAVVIAFCCAVWETWNAALNLL